MLIRGIRACDVCEQEIPKGETYYRSTCRPEAGAVLASDPEMTFGRNPDGTVTLDICMDCYVNMDVDGTKTIN